MNPNDLLAQQQAYLNQVFRLRDDSCELVSIRG